MTAVRLARLALRLLPALVLAAQPLLAGPAPKTIEICHVPPGNPANRQTIKVSESALPAHLAHGDSLCPCAKGALVPIPGAPGDLVNAEGTLPDVPFPGAGPESFLPDPDLGLLTSKTRLLVVFKNDVTVAQANAALQSAGAGLSGTLPEIRLVLAEVPAAADLTCLLSARDRLQADPRVAVAVQDTEIGVARIPAPSTLGGWTWPLNYGGVPMPAAGGAMVPAPPTDGNWGLEASRAPAMWNLNDAIAKSGATTLTGVLDLGFQAHVDLGSLAILPPALAAAHGNHVAGIIGATYDNRVGAVALGVDGINPFASLFGKTITPPVFPYFSSVLQDLANLLNGVPALRAINISLGYNWGPNFGIDPNTDADAQQIVIGHGILMRLLAALHPGQIFVPAAGNDSNSLFGFPAEVRAMWGSPMNWAALGPAIAIPPLTGVVTPSPPTAQAGASLIDGEAPLSVKLSGEGLDPDGGAVSFDWSFGDGGSSSDQDTAHTFAAPGSYEVVLTVTDDEGDASPAALTVVVSGADPAVQVSAQPIAFGIPPIVVQLTSDALDPDGGALSYFWDFGDGTVSTAASPLHAYSGLGAFAVTLTVTDDEGASASAGVTVYVGLVGALWLPAPNILVVESTSNIADPNDACPANFCKSDFSNVGGFIAAPGRSILSTVLGNGHATFSGTSMAAPHVTGLIGYLLAFDPGLNLVQIKNLLAGHSVPVLLRPGDVLPAGAAIANRIDAFATAVGIDKVRPGKPVQRALVDTDDGTIDGDDRLVAADLRGDGQVTMRDFRRFRDAYLIAKSEFFPALAALVDPGLLVANPKSDLNRDGCANLAAPFVCAHEENVYPRFDFNGDGVLDDAAATFKGAARSDVEVLAEKSLWDLLDRTGAAVRLNEEVSVEPGDEGMLDLNPNQDNVRGPGHWLLADRPPADGRIDYLYSFDLRLKINFAAPATDLLVVLIQSGPWSKTVAYDSTPSAPPPPTDVAPLPAVGMDDFIVTVPLYEAAPVPAVLVAGTGHLTPAGAPLPAAVTVVTIDVDTGASDSSTEVLTPSYGSDVTLTITVP